MPREKQSTENHGAHAGTRKGTSDYNDGGNTDYWLGNDDYIRNQEDHDRNFVEDAFSVGKGLPEEDVGKIAYGNKYEDATEEDEEMQEDVKETHVMSDDELVDEESMESFPASDPPGHRSKSVEDKRFHS